MNGFRCSAIFVIFVIAILRASAAPPKPVMPTNGPPAPTPISIFDMLFPPPARADPNVKQAPNVGSFLNFPGLLPATPPSGSVQQQSSMVGGIDFSQITRLCETMAAANRAKKMTDAVRAAAVQPKDIVGWMDLIRQVEPMPFETMACQMLQRLITSPDEFVSDLLRMIMPPGTGDLSQQFPQFNQQLALFASTTTAPVSILPSTISTPKPTGAGRRERDSDKRPSNAKSVNETVSVDSGRS